MPLNVTPLALLAVALAATGCSVQTSGSHDNADVKIETPFGGMKVKTNDNVAAADIGLALYPGSTRVKKDRDNGSADVDMNFGDFHLRVKADSYRTSDSPEKVIAYYRKELARYGDVIACKGNRPVGTPSKTRDGLTCDDDKQADAHVHEMSNTSDFELKAGDKTHQHIVAVEKETEGTKFGLVALELPDGKKGGN
jgi:hypothetical protein